MERGRQVLVAVVSFSIPRNVTRWSHVGLYLPCFMFSPLFFVTLQILSEGTGSRREAALCILRVRESNRLFVSHASIAQLLFFLTASL